MQNRSAISILLHFRKFQTICPLPFAGHLLSLKSQALQPFRQRFDCASLSQLMTKKLVQEFEMLANSLKSGDAANQELSIPALAGQIAKSLHVKTDEVAILAISERRRQLRFLVPDALRNVGEIPLSSTSALAARTVRDSRPEIVNNFSTVRHASVFEGVKAESLNASAIQRIISAPILADGKVIGVIQISRKAATVGEAGPEFTADDLGKLLAICKPLGKLIQHVAKD
jgi:GAF domain-containing protein